MEIDRLLLSPACYCRPTTVMPVSLTAWLCGKMYTSVEHDFCTTCYETTCLERPLLLGRRGGRPRQVLLYSSTCHERPPPVRSESGPSWQVAPRGRERKFMTSSQKHSAYNIAAKLQHSDTTFNYNILMLTYTLSDNNYNMVTIVYPEHCSEFMYRYMCVCACVHV